MTLVILVVLLVAIYAIPLYYICRSPREKHLIEGMSPNAYAHYGRTLEQIRNAPEAIDCPLVER